MGTTFSTKHALPAPDGTDLISNGDNQIVALRDAIDAIMATDDQGLLSARPAAASANRGKYFWATDTLLLYRSTGSSWVVVSPGEAHATYKTPAERRGVLTTTSSSPYVAGQSGSMAALVNQPIADATVIYFDPADYAVAGRTTKCRLRAQLITNSVAPAVTFTVGLYAVTAFGGGSAASPLVNTIGTVIAGSTVVFTTPGASNGGAQGNSGDFTAPSAAFYVIGVAVSGAAAANSSEAISVQLQVRTV